FGFAAGGAVLHFDDLGRDAGHHGIGWHVGDDHRTGGHHGALPHPDALNDHGVGADEHIVLDDHRRGAGGLDDAGQNGARADVAVLTHGGAAAQHDAHVDHGALAHHGADVEDGAHHDNGILLNGHLFADDGAGLDACRDVLQIQQRNGRVAAVVFHHQIFNFILIGLENGL